MKELRERLINSDMNEVFMFGVSRSCLEVGKTSPEVDIVLKVVECGEWIWMAGWVWCD